MFEIGSLELLLVAIVTLLVVGPKDLPRLMRTVGYWVNKARGTARHFRAGLDTMVREAELEEMQKKWDAHNADIMAGRKAQADDGEARADQQQAAPPPPPAPPEASRGEAKPAE